MGFLDSLRVVLKVDFLRYEFPDFHYGLADVPNNTALFGTLGVESIF